MNAEQKKNYDMQLRLRKGIPLIEFEKEDVEYIEKPLGKANFLDISEKQDYVKDKNIHPKEKVECIICKRMIIKRNMYIHRRTKRHQEFMKINSKLRELLVD